MKKIICTLLLVLAALIHAETVNGDTIRVKGLKVLRVWGSHQERGYAYGNLMAVPIMELLDNYVMPALYSNNTAIYNYVRSYYQQKYINDQVIKDETGALIRGMRSAGVDLYNQILGRNLDSLDILMINSVPDLAALGKNGPASSPGCADLLSWGAATMEALNGGTLVTRHLDWSNSVYLKKNSCIYVHFPSEDNEQNWAGFGFAGLIGALSGVNEKGTVTFQNQGNYASAAEGSGFYPINLAQRRGIELADANSDGISNFKDVYSFIRAHEKAYTYIVTAVSPIISGAPFVLECHNAKSDSARTKNNNVTDMSDNLIVTNHQRVLYPPASCYRYTNVSDSLSASPVMTPDRSWDVLANGAGHSGTLQTIQFIPGQSRLRLAFSEPNGLYSYMQVPKEILLNDLFAPVSIEEKFSLQQMNISAYPNPFNPVTTIAFKTLQSGFADLKIYNIKGETVAILMNKEIASGTHSVVFNGQNLSSGIYFCKITQNGNSVMHKLVLTK